MSVTAAQVISRLNIQFSDTSNGKWSEVEKLEAVNYAIDNAWPHIRATAQDVSQTITAGTYEYSPSATPNIKDGFAEAYATLDGYPDALLRQVSQSQAGATFTVRLSDQVASDYHGYTLRLVYTTPTPRVTATTDTIELPLDYLAKAAAVFLNSNKMFDESKADVSAYEKMLVKAERDLQMALIAHQNLGPALKIPHTLDGQGGSNRERRLTSGYFA